MAGNYSFLSGRRSSKARKLASRWRDRQRAKFQGILALERLESRDLLTSVTISANPNSTTEGSGNYGQFSFVRPADDPGTSNRTVNYSISGTATNTTDYSTLTGSITILAGLPGAMLNVVATSDGNSEGAETVILTLTGSDTGNATVTINDSGGGGGMPTLSISNADSYESGGTMTFGVSLSAATGMQVTVNYATSNVTASAGSDYTQKSGMLTFPANSTSPQYITVNITNDTVDEPNETFNVTLSTPMGATILSGHGTGVGMIVDNDEPPTLSIDDVSSSESAGNFVFTVTLSYSPASDVTFNYATASGSATSGQDFSSTSGSKTFTAGTTTLTQTISVPITQDSLDEDTENFYVNLSNPNGATFLDSQGEGAITDDDAMPDVTIASATGAESVGTLGFGLTLSAVSGRNVTVNYSTTEGSATPTADYQHVYSGSAIIYAGNLTATAGVPIVDDQNYEQTESFSVSIVSATNATYSSTAVTGTITDNDSQPSTGIGTASAAESAGYLSFPVTLSAASWQTITVDAYTQEATALSPEDYTGVPSTAPTTITFNPGETTKSFSVPIVQDALDEDNETFSGKLTNPSNASLGTSTATGTITDDDATPSLEIRPIKGGEEWPLFPFLVTLSAPSGRTVTVHYESMEDTADSPEDFEGVSGTLTFLPGETEQLVLVEVFDDLLVESTEQFWVNLSSPVNATLASSFAAGTILDNDSPDNQPIYCNCFCGCPNVETATDKDSGDLALLAAGYLIYHSGDNPHPIVTVDTPLSDDAADATSVEVRLTFGGIVGDSIFYDPAGLPVGEVVRFAVQADASALATGRYDWTLEITEHYADESTYERTFVGNQVIDNRISTEFGNRWSFAGLSRLTIDDDGVTLQQGDGNLFWFAEQANGSYQRQAAEPGFSTLVKLGDDTFTLTAKDGSVRRYSAAGLLTSSTDANDNTTDYAYTDADGDSQADELLSITDVAGRTTTLAYTSGKLATVTDFSGRVTSFTFDGSGRLTDVYQPDPDGGGPLSAPHSTFTYDSTTNLVTSVTNALGSTTEFEYDAARALSRRTNPDLTYKLFDAGRAQGVVDTSTGLGSITNPAPLLELDDVRSTETDELGNVTSYTTGRFGFVTSVTDPLGATTLIERDADGRVTRQTSPDPDGPSGSLAPLVTEFEYDARGNLIGQTLPDGSERAWTYESTFNRVTSFTDELGRVTLFEIDAANGNVLSVTQVVGLEDSPGNGQTDDVTTTFTYTAAPSLTTDPPGGLVATQTDPMGVTTAFAYNQHGLPLEVTYAVGTSLEASITLEYDSADNLTAVVDELGRRTQYTYDALDRQTTMTAADPDGTGELPAAVTTMVYNAMSRVTRQTDPLGRHTDFVYGAFGKLTQLKLPDHDSNSVLTITTFGYDAAGRQISVTDPIGRVTAAGYDDAGRQVSQTAPDPDGEGLLESPVTNTAYDALGRVISYTDAAGNQTDIAYQDYGKRIVTTAPDPDGEEEQTRGVTIVQLDAAGQVVSETDALGRVTSHVYSALGNLITTTLPDPDGGGPLSSPVWQYAYNKNGQLTGVTDPLGRVTQYTLDARGRVTAITLPDPDGPLGGQSSPVWSMAYDDANQIVSQTDPRGYVTLYAWDLRGRLLSETAPDPDGAGPGVAGVTTYGYDNADRLITITLPDPDGAGGQPAPVITYAYDVLDNRITVTAPDPDGAGSGSAPVTHYVFDAAGQLVSQIDAMGHETVYTLDGLGRTTRVTDELGNHSDYVYDILSNLIAATDELGNETSLGYDALSRRISTTDPLDGVTSFVFDLVGNLTRLTDPNGNATNWVYDNLDRQKTETDELDGVRSFSYDAAGNLTSRTDRNGRTEEFLWDNLDRLTTETWKGTGANSMGSAPPVTITTVAAGGGGYTSEVQKLVLPTAQGGTWTISFGGQTTSNIAWNASASTVQTALAALSNVGSGNVSVSGAGSQASPFVLAFQAGLSAADLPQITVNTSGLTGTGVLGIVTTTEGTTAHNEVQQVTFQSSTGNWLYVIGLDFHTITATSLQARLQDWIGSGNVTVSGSWPTFEITFQGAFTAQDVAELAGTGDVTTIVNGNAASNEVQTVTVGSATSGSFKLSFTGGGSTQTTVDIFYDAPAAYVEGALRGLSNIGSSDVNVSGNSGGPFAVTFTGALAATNVNLLTADTTNLNGSTATSIQTDTHGALGANEVQSVGFTASTSSVGGTFQLTHNGATTGDLAWNASAATVQAALAGLSTIGSGNVLVTKTADTSTQQTWRLTFVAGRGAQDVPQTTIDTDDVTVSGGSATPSAVTNTAGHDSDNEVQQVQLNGAQSGTFTLTLAGQTTAAIAYNASAATVKSALEALSNLDNVTVTGSAGGPYEITFGGSSSGTNLAQLTSNASSLTYVSHVFQYTYDPAGNLLTASDNDSAYAYAYDGLGRVTSVDNNGTPNIPRVILANTFDTLSRRTQLTASIGGTADFLNAYGYDGLSRMTHVEQRGQTGGNTVASKGVDFAYNALGQFTSIVRYTDLVNGPAVDVATSSFTYDSLSRLTGLTHSHASNTLAGYSWTYDALSRITHMDSIRDDGESDYTYDATSQLVAADHDYQTDEEYSFDANGNRNGTGQTVGAGNRPITDGVFNFTYDAEGNLTVKVHVSSSPADDHRTEYRWDHRNRLTSVTFKNNSGAVTKYVETVYDVFDRRIGKRVDSDGDGDFDRYERFVYDGDDVVLDFVDPDGAGSEPLALATRYLQGPAVDQILAQEDVETNAVLWQLTDNLGSVRDLVDSDGDLVAHYVYDSFGNLVSTPDGQTRYLYTGREWDADIGLQYNRARWYDPALGRWLSEDPIGFAAGDPNVGADVGNGPTNSTDPFGLEGVGHHYLPQAYIKLFLKEGLIDEDAFNLAMAYTSGPLTSHVYDTAHKRYSARVAALFVNWASAQSCGKIGAEQLKGFIDSIASGKNPITGKVDKLISTYLSKYVNKKLVGKLLDNSNVKELIERGAKYPPAKKFLAEMVEASAKGLLGKKGGKVAGKRIPLIGIVIAVYFWSDDVEARGPVTGTCNSIIDAIPGVGTVKGLGEFAIGGHLIDTYDDEEIRKAKWEVVDELLRMKEEEDAKRRLGGDYGNRPGGWIFLP